MNGSPPLAVTWFKVYAGAMALCYLVMFVGGIAVLNADPNAGSGDPGSAAVRMVGWGFTLFGLPLAALFAAGLSVKPTRPWWINCVVLIALGVCCLPFIIPLVLLWLEPEVKEWFYAAPRPSDDSH